MTDGRSVPPVHHGVVLYRGRLTPRLIVATIVVACTLFGGSALAVAQITKPVRARATGGDTTVPSTQPTQPTTNPPTTNPPTTAPPTVPPTPLPTTTTTIFVPPPSGDASTPIGNGVSVVIPPDFSIISQPAGVIVLGPPQGGVMSVVTSTGFTGASSTLASEAVDSLSWQGLTELAPTILQQGPHVTETEIAFSGLTVGQQGAVTLFGRVDAYVRDDGLAVVFTAAATQAVFDDATWTSELVAVRQSVKDSFIPSA